MSDYNMIKAEIGGLQITPAGVAVSQVSQYFGLAELMQRGGFLPKGVNVEGAVIAMIHGATVGLAPFPAVQGIAVVNGRPTVWGDTMTAICKASGLLADEKSEWINGGSEDKQGYKYTVVRKGIPTPYSATYTIAMAKKAGLWTKAGSWQTNPYRMLFVRARSFALRDAFSDILQGFACREEVEDEALPAEGVTVAPPPYAEAEKAEKAEPKKRKSLIAAASKAAVAMKAPAVEIDPAAIEEVESFNGEFPAEKAEKVEPPKAVPAAPAEAVKEEPQKADSKLGHAPLSFQAEKR